MERRFTTEERGWLNEFLIQAQRQTAALEGMTIALGQISEMLSILMRQQEILLLKEGRTSSWTSDEAEMVRKAFGKEEP